MIVRMKNTFRMLLAAMLLSLFALPGYSWQKSFPEKDYVAYLFTYFTGNSGDEEAVRYAVSMDGYTYWALNDNEPVIDSKVISSTGGVRDPHILRCEDGKTFYMVVTDMVSANGWSSNRAMVLLKSTDLVNWSHSAINIQKRYSGQEDLKRVWAPQTIYDPEVGSTWCIGLCCMAMEPMSYIMLMPMRSLRIWRESPSHCFCRRTGNRASMETLSIRMVFSTFSIRRKGMETA